MTGDSPSAVAFPPLRPRRRALEGAGQHGASLLADPPPRWIDRVAYASFAVIALAVYLPFSLQAGWYYDDWLLYSQAQDTSGGWGHQVSVCSASVPGGRSLACLYHVTEYDLLGSHRYLYHLWVIVMLVGIAALAYCILKRCRLGWPWAWLCSALMLISPLSDSARLWPTAAIGQAVIAIQLGGVLLALIAQARYPRRSAVALDVLAVLLSVLAMVTYEIAVPLVALNGLIYLAAYRNRRAIARGALDLGLAIAFVIYRATISPVSAASGFDVKRTESAEISRAWLLIKTATHTWRFGYTPGTLGLIGIIVTVVVAGVAAVAVPESRRTLLIWSAVLVGAAAICILCALTYITANDLYLPDSFSTFNRLNLPATLPYAVVFVAFVRIGFTALASLLRQRWLAVVVLAAVVSVVTVHQLRVSASHRTAWSVSWQQQQTAIRGYRRAVAGLPRDSRILGFDTPEWEDGFIPIFASTWDLRGAIAYTTHVDPPAALPFSSSLACGRLGVTFANVVVVAYQVPGEPLFAVSPRRDRAVPVRTQAACARVLRAWGPVPFWGRTVTG